jgi:hypothetical protein
MLPHLLCHDHGTSNSDQPSTARSDEDFEYSLDSMDGEEDEGNEDEGDDDGDVERADKKILQAVIDLFQNIIVSGSDVINIAMDAYNSYSNAHYNKQPYHTSALQGISWVTELLTGHPECICCELGVHHHIFMVLLNILQESGINDLKNVKLEEQLAIFLYACITGLSVHHLGEHFQRSNDTISRYVSQQLSSR